MLLFCLLNLYTPMRFRFSVGTVQSIICRLETYWSIQKVLLSWQILEWQHACSIVVIDSNQESHLLALHVGADLDPDSLTICLSKTLVIIAQSSPLIASQFCHNAHPSSQDGSGSYAAIAWI